MSLRSSVRLGSLLLTLSLSLFSKTFFYQQYLKNFGNFQTIEFTEKLHILELLDVFQSANGLDSNLDAEEGPVNLIANQKMYADYFSMRMTDEGHLLSIPVLVDGYRPNLNLLPLLIWNLCSVRYKEEKPCFKMIGEAFADFYSRPVDKLDEHKTNVRAVFSRFKEEIRPNPDLNSSIKSISELQQFYKIFERC